MADDESEGKTKVEEKPGEIVGDQSIDKPSDVEKQTPETEMQPGVHMPRASTPDGRGEPEAVEKMAVVGTEEAAAPQVGLVEDEAQDGADDKDHALSAEETANEGAGAKAMNAAEAERKPDDTLVVAAVGLGLLGLLLILSNRKGAETTT